MRVIAVVAFAIAILVWGIASQSAPHSPEQNAATIDPSAMHRAIDVDKLPNLESAALF